MHRKPKLRTQLMDAFLDGARSFQSGRERYSCSMKRPEHEAPYQASPPKGWSEAEE
jgi:hypothetical protein